MNDDKIKNIFENKIIRERLYNAGMYPMIGPTGPRGKKIVILDSYDTYEELLEKHPKGNIGPKGDKDITINNTGLFEITAPANLRIKTEITGDKKTSNILFSTINVLIKGYYV